MTQKYVYTFGDGQAEGDAAMRNQLGGKGANLAEMSAMGLPVPPGFTITTDVCVAYYAHDKTLPDGVSEQVEAALRFIEARSDTRFGDSDNPLLVSVRSGARASMPGMMDTVLNLGLNDHVAAVMAEKTGNPRFAYDSYRRFIQMYGDVVLGVEHHHFEEMLENLKFERGYILDTEFTTEDLLELVGEFKEEVERVSGAPFPQDPKDQLWGAIHAVFDSWMNRRAITYRQLHDIPESWGTAVTVQAMVFGNMGDDCATGVAFTRNPSTGENRFYGEFLVNAQGEDVVAGIRTPQPLTVAGKEPGSLLPALEEVMPDVFDQLVETSALLERHYRDMQDIEFTVQNRKLWMLQTRTGKRSAAAAVRIAVEMCKDEVIIRQEALMRVDPLMLDQLLHPTLNRDADTLPLSKGLPASPGAASGRIALSADEAAARTKLGEQVMLVRIETSPEDIHGMHVAEGILTARGGMTSHAAVVARGMGKPCVSGAAEVQIDYVAKTLTIGEHRFQEGELLTIDGSTGEIFAGELQTMRPSFSEEFAELMRWADDTRTMTVRTNADTPQDAGLAREFGAGGIGLCRTEHMFFEKERIVAMREMILAESQEAREKALARLLPMQRADFAGLFTAMAGLPVTIRLLDPPLHEFLPHSDEDAEQVAAQAGVSLQAVRERSLALHETNPMLGHRGCRLGITYPEIYAMQVRAILEAALEVEGRTGAAPVPEIMVPLISDRAELFRLKALIEETADSVFAETGKRLTYLVGTMIELPRAALQAGVIAEDAQFFSFGTNDLTQTTFGISRDDAGQFLSHYQKSGLYSADPFVTLDEAGVGELIRLAAERGRATRPEIKLGICGEHGGDPRSIAFCQRVGLDYVSCSPYRVPIARLAAAQAALQTG